MWGHNWYGYGWGWGPAMAVQSLVSLAVVVLIVYAAIRLLRPGARPHHLFRARSLDILEERYVRGEIGRDEYLQKKQDLGG